MIKRYQAANQALCDDQHDTIREELIRKYAPLVKYFAERFALRLPPHITVDELQSAGTMGLFDALDNFDPDKGIKFQTYAAYRIKGSILDELRKMDWVPRSVRRDIQRIEDAVATLQIRLEREPEETEIARELGVDMAAYHKLLNRAQGVRLISIDDVRRSGASPISETLASNNPSPLDEFKKKELKKVVADILAELSQKEQLVMSLYYYEELTLKEIAKVLGLTESRISQIHSKVIIGLRAKMKSYHNA